MRQHAIEQLEQRTLLTGDVDLSLTFGAPQSAHIARTAADSAGNIYVAGTFGSALTFGRRTLNSNGGTDVFVGKYSPAGRLLWARSIGSATADGLGDLAVDVSDNVIVAGHFGGEADFDPSRRSFILHSAGRQDAFVWKLDPRGQLLWAQSAGGKHNDTATALTTDADGNVFIAGTFRTTIFDGRLALDGGKGRSGFVWSTNPDGNTRFARQFHGEGSVSPRDITLDPAGNVLTAGFFTGAIDFAPGKPQSVRVDAGSGELFISRLTRTGRYAGAMTLGGMAGVTANAVATDAQGNLWLTGQFDSDADFDPTDGNTLLSTGGVFIAKYDARWSLKMAKRIGEAATDAGTALTIDPAGAVYIAGHYSGSPDFDIGSGEHRMTADGPSDGFLLKITSAGKFAYARSLGAQGIRAVESIALGLDNAVLAAGGALTRLAQRQPSFSLARLFGNSGTKQLNALAVDDQDDLYIVGTFSGTLTFGAGVGQKQFVSNGGTDVFIGKFCNKCNFLWAKTIGGPGDDSGKDIALMEDGSLAITGTFEQTMDSDPGTGVSELTSAGGKDMFVLKLDGSGAFNWVRPIGTPQADSAGPVAAAGNSICAAGVSGSPFVARFDDSGMLWRSDDAEAAAIEDLLATKTAVYAASTGSSPAVRVRQLSSVGGDALWTYQATGATIDVASLSLMPDGRLLVGGTAAGAVDFGGTASSSSGDEAGFILELTEQGTFHRLHALPGMTRLTAARADAFGGIYATGSFTGSASFGAFALSSDGGSDVFLVKLDDAGQSVWAGSMGGAGGDDAADLVTGGSGAFAWLLGAFTDEADLDPTTGVFTQTAAGTDAFLTRVVL